MEEVYQTTSARLRQGSNANAVAAVPIGRVDRTHQSGVAAHHKLALRSSNWFCVYGMSWGVRR
jgi:hypothetical protein